MCNIKQYDVALQLVLPDQGERAAYCLSLEHNVNSSVPMPRPDRIVGTEADSHAGHGEQHFDLQIH